MNPVPTPCHNPAIAADNHASLDSQRFVQIINIDQVQARFAGLADISAWITVYTIADNSPDLAEATLTEFVRDLGGAI